MYEYLRKIDSAFADTLKNGHFVPVYFENGKYLGHEKPKDLSAIFNIDVSPCSISSISIWPSDSLMAIRSTNERGHLRA